VFQFAARGAASEAAGELSAPDPITAELDAKQSRASFVISCVLGPEGALKDLRVVRGGAGTEAAKALLETVATWRFHPALSRGNPVAVDALIGIRTGVH
jgi:TonB-like protein